MNLSPLSTVGIVLNVLLTIYFFTMWARFGFDLVQGLSRGWRPRRALLIVAEYTYTVTDPPIRFFRRLIPPLRVGPLSLDFGWSLTMLLVIIAMYAVALLL